MDRVVAILQARMQSSRLPGKILADLGGKPMVAHIIERLRATEGIDRVVLAVPESEAPYLAPVASLTGAEIHAGNPRDVLGRFYTAAERFPSELIVRATADNPLVDTGMLARCIEEAATGHWDMVGCREMPLGTSSEVFPSSLLDYLNMYGHRTYHREHVTTLVYENEEGFEVRRLAPPESLRAPGLRLTVDTPEDMALLKIIYSNLYRNGELVSLAEVIEFLREHPNIARINSHVEQRSWRDQKASEAVA